MTSSSVTSCKKAISVFKESVQIPSQKSRILCFCPDAHQCREASEQFQVASIWTSWQHIQTLFRVREDSCFPLQTQIGKTACTRSENRQNHPDEILDKEIAYIQSATIRTPGQHRLDVVLDKVIMCRQVATVRTLGQHYSDATLI
jgi:hypothetical protein